ncbi:MAG: hypothetical protein U9Q22_03445 [Candidatus Altiarchaeota archaeon]|nr:hypothetical protein [Candidatus Altiarchaeota archaeon]
MDLSTNVLVRAVVVGIFIFTSVFLMLMVSTQQSSVVGKVTGFSAHDASTIAAVILLLILAAYTVYETKN